MQTANPTRSPRFPFAVCVACNEHAGCGEPATADLAGDADDGGTFHLVLLSAINASTHCLQYVLPLMVT